MRRLPVRVVGADAFTCWGPRSGEVDPGGRRARLTPHPVIWLDVAMKRVKIAELKDQLSRHLREVERGAEVVVTDRERPIARIVPVSRAGAPVVVIPPSRPFSSLRRKRYAPAGWRVSSTDLLLEERQRR